MRYLPCAKKNSTSVRRNIGMVFQESALFDSLTVEENVAYRLIEETGRVTDEIHDRVLEVLRFVELEKTWPLSPAEFRAECGAAWLLRAPSSPSPKCCFTTRQPADSTL